MDHDQTPSRLRRFRTPLAALVGAAALVAGASTYSVVSAQPPATEQSAFVATTPTRVFDTRIGLGTAGGAVAKLGPGTSTTFIIADDTVVPATATGVVLNVTAANPTADAWVALHPAGSPPPQPVSNVNFLPGQTVANQVTVGVGEGGAIVIVNPAGSTDVFIDVFGYYAAVLIT